MRFPVLALLVCSSAAGAQPANCVVRQSGPSVPLDVYIDLAGQPGVPKTMQGAAHLDLGETSATVMACAATVPDYDDVLAGAPAPNGLLRTNGPRDVLTNRPTGRVTIQTLPPVKP
jgi:hypothetical protein